MEKIKYILEVFNLVNEKGECLQLRLGVLENPDGCGYRNDHGFRWSFIGRKIPMPVRHGTWFNGFPKDIMLSWLKENGWYLETHVNMLTGKSFVYKVPKPIYSLSEGWWKSLSGEKKEAILSLPNFDRLIFKKITGIDVDA